MCKIHKSFYVLLSLFFLIFFVSCGSTSTESKSEDHLIISRVVDTNGISMFDKLRVVFSSKLDSTTVNSTNIFIQDDKKKHVNIKIGLDYNNTEQVIITPKKYLKPLTNYTLVVTSKLQNIKKKSLNRNYVYHFTTLADTVPVKKFAPDLFKPTDNGNGVEIDSDVFLEFNRFISYDSLGDIKTLLKLKDKDNKLIPADILVFNSMIRLKPKQNLQYNMTYTLGLQKSIPDMYGDIYDINKEKKRWTFSTTTQQNSYTTNGFADLNTTQTTKQIFILRTLTNSNASSTFIVATKDSLDLYKVEYPAIIKKPLLKKIATLPIDFQVTAMQNFSNGSFMIGTARNGVYTYNTDSNTINEVSHIAFSEQVYGIYVSAYKAYSVGAKDGLRVYDIDKTTSSLTEQKHIYLKKYIMLDVVATQDAKVFVADYNGAILVYDASLLKPTVVSVKGSVKKLMLDSSNSRILVFNSIGAIQSVDFSNILSPTVVMLPNHIVDINKMTNSAGDIQKIFICDGEHEITVLDSNLKNATRIANKKILSATPLTAYKSKIAFMAFATTNGKIVVENLNSDTVGATLSTSPIVNNLLDINGSVSFVIKDDYLDSSEINKQNIEFKNDNNATPVPFNIALDMNDTSSITCKISAKDPLINDVNYTLTVKDTLKDMIGNKLKSSAMKIHFKANAYKIATLKLTGSSSVTEGVTATYTIKLSHKAKLDTNVNIIFKNITTDSTDVTPPITSYTIKAGSDTVTFDIKTIDDNIVDNDKDFSVTLVNVTDGGGYKITTDTTALKTTVLNNDVAAAPVTVPQQQYSPPQ